MFYNAHMIENQSWGKNPLFRSDVLNVWLKCQKDQNNKSYIEFQIQQKKKSIKNQLP